jgi:hydroxyacyl-ACP dehydratase HTD2-like protein with hotdog domain
MIAPPTFPRTLDYGQIEGLALPAAGVIHGEQAYEYYRPLYIGEEVLCHATLRHVAEKKGRSGLLTFLTFERAGEDPAGQRIFTATEVAVLTEPVIRSIG